MPQTLHVISFDIPFPADYGGVIDVYYKLKALKKAGVNVILHCFEYGRAHRKELNQVAKEVYYYTRKNSRKYLFNTYPYIVLSRQSDELRERLLKDNYPILMEGLHSTFLLNDPAFAERRMMVRTHNVEHDYYENLARVEKNIFKRYYFYNEAGKLLKYESTLKKASAVFAISPADTVHFGKISSHVTYVPAFHPFEEVTLTESQEKYFLYHGNLAVGENNEAAIYLTEKVFNDLPYQLIIAGNRPSADLKKAVKNHPNVQLMDSLNPDEIYSLIANARCNILPTFQATGIKLKLLAALFLGKHCIVNTPMIANTGLEKLCMLADSPEAMKERVKEVMAKKSFTREEFQLRQDVLMKQFSNGAGAERILKAL
ncbi:MAG: glycosyltransferase [Bacteroidetes bacterium]|nr:glycosyltransferase [Bacteroidota bacterium]